MRRLEQMRRMGRRGSTRRTISTLMIVAAITLPACGRSDRRAAIRIGTLYPAGGSQGEQGSQERRGVEMAAQYVNEHGGVSGKRIELVPVDADRAEAVPAAMESLRARGVDVVVGSHGSSMSAVAADVATEKHMLFWETGAVGQTDNAVTGGENFIRMAPMGANLGRAAIAFIRDEMSGRLPPHGPLHYGVAYVDDEYGRAVGGGARAELQASGQTVAGTFPYPASTTDFADLAGRIKDSGTDVLFVSAYIDDGVALRQATIAAGVPLLASIGTSSSYCHPAFGARLGTGADGLFASDKPDAADVRPDALSAEGRAELTWAKARYAERFGGDMDAPALSGFSNATALFGHVLEAAGGTSAAARVARAALSLKLPVGTLANGGGMDIAPPGAPDAGNNRNAASVIWEWLPPTHRVVVWPPAFATHPIEAIRPAQ